MSTWYVNNTLDAYPVAIPGSLRWAIEQAFSGDSVVSQTTGTITLADSSLVLTFSIEIDDKSLTIDGTGLTITAGNPNAGAFKVGSSSIHPVVVFKNFHMTQVTGIAVSVTGFSDVSVINCIFDSPNTSSTGISCFGFCGNSFSASNSNFLVSDSTFTNSKYSAIAFLLKSSSTLQVTNSIFMGLAPQALAATGGAAISVSAFPSNVVVKIDSSTFSGNTALTAVVNFLSTATTIPSYSITRSTFDSNYAPNGNTISFKSVDGSALIDSCTFYNNTNTAGGTVKFTTIPVQIARTTISGNMNGGVNSTVGPLTLYSSIISNNQGLDIGAPSLNSLGYNIYGIAAVASASGATSTDIISSTPGLAALANNGGPTKTMALISGSPAANANKDTTVTNPTYDQRGSPYLRLVGAFQDIGAYERQGPTTSSITQSLTYLEDTAATNSLPNIFSTFDGTPVTFTQISVLNPSLFQSTSVSGVSITAQPAANQFGNTIFTITGSDSFGLTTTGQVTVTILPVNDPPTFTKGQDISVDKGGQYQFTSWATNISPGPPDESNQIVSFTTGIVSTTNTIAFTANPSVTSTGLLSFTLDSNTFGVANVSVFAMDNGGTLNGGQDTSPIQYFTITLNEQSATKTPTSTKKTVKTPKTTPHKPTRKPTATPSDGTMIKPNVLEIVDPTSALMLGVVVAKMTTNLWSWASSLFGAKKESETLMSVGNIKQCQTLAQECEKKIEDICKNDIKNESKWLLYSLEDLRDDIFGALKSRRLPTEEEVAEFSERMEAIAEDYYGMEQTKPSPVSPMLATVKEASASFVDHTVRHGFLPAARTVAKLGSK